MKCIKKETKETVDGKINKKVEVKRVKDLEANEMVKKDGWSFCPKSEWKNKSKTKVEKVETKDLKNEVPKNKYRKGYNKYNKKQTSTEPTPENKDSKA